MRKLLLLALVVLCSVPVQAADLLPESAKKELKNAFQSQALLEGDMVTGIEFGIDLNAVNRLLNSAGDIWVKKTKWNEIWLEDVRMDYSSSSRFSLEAVLRYRTYTKNIFKPSNRWRTASYYIRLKGSVAVRYENNTLALDDFKVDLMDLKHFPGWAENAVKDYVNGKLATAIPLPFEMKGIATRDIRLDSLRKDGTVVVATLLLSDAARFNVGQLKQRVENAQATLLTGVDFAPKVISANIDRYPDNNGGDSFGLALEFAGVPGVTNGIQIMYRENNGSWRYPTDWFPDDGDVGRKDQAPRYKGILFGGTRNQYGDLNLPANTRIEWKARYNFSPNGIPQLGTQWVTGELEVPDYGIRAGANGPELDAPKIREFSVVDDPEKGRYFSLRVERPLWANYGDVYVIVSLRNHHWGSEELDIYGTEDFGRTYWGNAPIKKRQTSLWCQSEESMKNGFDRTIVCDRQFGTLVKDGKQNSLIDIPAGSYVATVSLIVYLKPKDGTGGRLVQTPLPRQAYQKIEVPAHPVAPPVIRNAESTSKGIALAVKAGEGDFYEVEYKAEDRNIPWPSDSANGWERQLIRVNPASSIILPPEKVDMYKQWNFRVRTALNSGYRSPWSAVSRANPMSRPVLWRAETTAKGIEMVVRFGEGDFYEVEYKSDAFNAGWPSDEGKGAIQTVKVEAASETLVPFDKVTIYDNLALRIRTGHNSGLRSPWSTERILVNAVPKPEVPKRRGTLIATATNNGTGARKTGGSSPRVAVGDLKNGDEFHFAATSGTCASVTIHGRTSYGSWRTIYQGSLQPQKVDDTLAKLRTSFTHLIFSANGAHESYEPKACTLEIRMTTADADSTSSGGAPASVQVTSLGVINNNGTGARKTGGKLMWIDLRNLQDNDLLDFTCTSGSCRYIAVHGRTTRGSWQTLFKGSPAQLRVADVLKGRRAAYSHIILSVNGAHERYDRVPCEMTVQKSTRP